MVIKHRAQLLLESEKYSNEERSEMLRQMLESAVEEQGVSGLSEVDIEVIDDMEDEDS